MSQLIEKRCFYCGSENLELEPKPEGVTWWCADCGRPNTRNQVDQSLSGFLCAECGQDTTPDEDGRRWHARELKAPRCSIHKAELVEKRRAAMRMVDGGVA